MKIQFNGKLDYQKEAIDSILGIFEGQEKHQINFSVPVPENKQLGFIEKDGNTQTESDKGIGVGNSLQLLDDEILENVRRYQFKNSLKQSEKLGGMDFSVEMETGTGKTYVYLKTILEMNQRYGFTKFIIVVPSVAIKEGVYKSLEITEQHFKEEFTNLPYQFSVYDSKKPTEARSFATADILQVMVITLHSFLRKETNIIHQPNDKTEGMKPIEFIQATRPIVIMDEPQNMESDTAKSAIASLNPLCTLRYSATHKDKYNLMYKLDSIDAYDQKLVKQIEVASIQAQDSQNKAYIRLVSVNNKKTPITAKVELDVFKKGKTTRETKTVKKGSDLMALANRDAYDGYVISDIYCKEGEEYIDFTSQEDIVTLGNVVGGINPDEFKRLQIEKTVEEHFEKELELKKQGIKVLSLFFIDRVANYRDYSAPDKKGKFAHMFEESFRKLMKKPKYQALLDGESVDAVLSEVHNGYFSQDKKGVWKDLRESDASLNSEDAKQAFNLIMKDKEKLLSFSSKLKFIFSHSALKEGWDNPNVFQICTLNETSSTMKKRQEIGRGLRLAVNQEGERVHGFEINTLTVVANEAYEDFVTALQNEIEKEGGIRFGVVEDHLFANILIVNEDGQEEHLGSKTSEKLFEHLLGKGYVDKKGKVQDSLKQDLKDDRVDLPPELEAHKDLITARLKKVAGDLNIKKHEDKSRVQLNKAVFLGEEFKELWEKVKFKTTFHVDFDTQKLIEACQKEIQNTLVVGKPKFVYDKAKQKIERGGLMSKDRTQTTYTYDAKDFILPDVVSILQNETNLTRRTLIDILQGSGKLDSFRSNPQKFIDEATSILKKKMRSFIIDGIVYQKLGDQHFYGQELFKSEELNGYLNKNMLESKKSVYSHVVYDSDVEQKFATSFEQNDKIKVYAKLPSWFKIDTPLGTYNPDWAVLVKEDEKEKLYFVVETKGDIHSESLRPTEKAKIECGKAHFKAIGEDVTFVPVDSYEKFEGHL